MNLSKLFETQRVLDERIELEHPLVDGEDRLAKKILALQVELGELANEWRGFKFWSNDQEPSVERECQGCGGSGEAFFVGDCEECRGTGTTNKLLEEYVDCLHFILSIGLEDAGFCVYNWHYEPLVNVKGDVIAQFYSLFKSIIDFSEEDTLELTIELFLGLGDVLGFTWEQIENAYYSKNAINHTRQETGY